MTRTIPRLAGVLSGLAFVALTGTGCASVTAQPSSRISVEFVDPQRFTDVKDAAMRSQAGAEAILRELERFIRETGDADLPAGTTLAVRVTDIDLAGDFEPWRGPQFERVRFMREIYWPRIDLDFRLTDAGGRVVKEGRRSLSDPLYLTHAIRVGDDPLRYEKQLLRDWLRRELGS